jgi:hypothetical protein
MNNLVLLAICIISLILISGCVAPVDNKQIINQVKNTTSASLKDMAGKLIDKFVDDFFNPLLTNNTNNTS